MSGGLRAAVLTRFATRAVEVMRRDQPAILFESGPGGAETYGITRGQLFSFLTEEHGYSVFLLRDYLHGAGPLDFAAFDDSHRYPFKAFNYLALAPVNR